MLNLSSHMTSTNSPENQPSTTALQPDLAKLLDSVVENAKFPALFRLHEMVNAHHRRFMLSFDRESTPKALDNVSLVDEIILLLEDFVEFTEDFSNSKFSRPVIELLHILRNPHLRALIASNCKVMCGDFEQNLPEVPSEVDEDEGLNVRIVRLIKNTEPLGATIKVDEKTGWLIIARVMHGGVADRSGCINVGDRVLEVNGVDVAGKQPVDVVKLLNASNGTVVFKLVPASASVLASTKMDPSNREGRIYLRAMFDYDPSLDKMNPCPEAGLSFSCHDVLQIVEWNDHHWWQACLVVSSDIEKCNKNGRVGLIPSKQLQELRLTQATSPAEKESLLFINSRRQKKVMYETRAADDYERDELRTYEEVALLYPRPGLHRPVVLVGPPGVGRNELKRRLILLNPDRFATTVPHTSRRPKPNETDGLEYRFTPRAVMERWAAEGLFIEFGEYKGNLYGTTAESVKSVLNQNRVCLLNPHPQAVRTLRTSDLKPYVIFVKPPSCDVLKDTRQTGRVRSTFDSTYNRGFTDDELEQMVNSGQQLERSYGQYFDCTLVNGHLEPTFRELLDAVYRLETQPQWVPANWV